jgi:hypothetical protein
MPATAHPLYDTAPLEKHQSGSIWFLGGIFNTSLQHHQVTRSGTIPAHTALFFPVVNGAVDTTGGWPPIDSLLYVANLPPSKDYSYSESAEIDGSSIPNIPLHRVVATRTLTVMLADSNAFSANPFWIVLTSGGDYLMIDSLCTGTHTIHFHADAPLFGLDITYNLDVK